MRILIGILVTLSMMLLIAIAGYVGYQYGVDDGYTDGFTAGAQAGVGTGYNQRNPTYQEAMDFTARDLTDENEYQEGIYTCSDFSSDFNNNAEAAGYRCAFVYIEYTGDFGHSIVAFDTVDQGMVYIEPQFDKVVTLSEGASYSDLNGFKEPLYDDTIRRFSVAW